MKQLIVLLVLMITFNFYGQTDLKAQFINIEPKVIEWRRHFHKNPELSNREFKTAEKIAKHLKSLGLEVKTNVAHTGVVAILNGHSKGKVIALRADIDALPVTERNELPYKSTVQTEFLGTKTGVAHACGHDAHTAILMGVAEILSKNRDKVNGTVKFIFQPAEEGPPPGEEGGSKLMIKEGVLEHPKVDAIFGLHIRSGVDIGHIHYKPGGAMAAVERFTINVKGKQTHGSEPWLGIDPILISAKIIDGLQTIISRESELINEAAVISVGKITSGVRFNIIPESAELIGTVRTLDPDMKIHIIERMKAMTQTIAKAYGGEASIKFENFTAVTYNDHELVSKMLPSLKLVAGAQNVTQIKAETIGEDFSYYQEKVPGFYFYLGGKPKNALKSPLHHTPDFMIDESGLLLGIKALTQITFDFLNN
ncbi:amidohydrolase [Tamlana sp. 2201CG12-4]|uniref:amidohydrolase n=1 Tax=Tamlana sp. 2201CG12-4 TaxID=3112582 RepID=UPI002DBA1A47|nr:amidohydrolase [Tamlana sp. 2201CG12-4]MEC3907942.1 amidohydrolase [Tamlana sp. 2201CG12-4]